MQVLASGAAGSAACVFQGLAGWVRAAELGPCCHRPHCLGVAPCHHHCRFAARMARVTCEVTRNVAAGGGGGARVKQLERCGAWVATLRQARRPLPAYQAAGAINPLHALHREVADLLEELAMHDLWVADSSDGAPADDAGGEPTSAPGAGSSAPAAAVAAARARYLPYPSSRRAELRGLVERYLLSGGAGSGSGGLADGAAGATGADDDVEEAAAVAQLRLDSMQRVREVLSACKVRMSCRRVDIARSWAACAVTGWCKQACSLRANPLAGAVPGCFAGRQQSPKQRRGCACSGCQRRRIGGTAARQVNA